MYKSQQSTTLRMLSAKTYFEELLKELAQAKRRIVLVSMIVASGGEQLDRLFVLLGNAARRNVSVRIVLDNHTYFFLAGELSPWQRVKTSTRQRVRRTKTILNKLQQSGVEVIHVGPIHAFNPYSGRSHIKMSIIDDTVYSFGGVNLIEESIDFSDYMLVQHSQQLADALVEVGASIAKDGGRQDRELSINAASILIDGGLPGHSIIYQRACQLAAIATEVIYVSQFCPTGRLASILQRTKTTCYFNQPAQAKAIQAGLMLMFDQLYTRIVNSYRRPKYLHAKYMLFTMPSGSKALLSGSHNFNWNGVLYGTREMALYSTNKELWQQFYDYTVQEIG